MTGGDVAGAVCLQGGREFGASCRDIDTAVLRRTPVGPVVVLAGAARQGSDYRTAARNGARHYGQLGGDEAVVAPDPRDDLDGCLAALERAALVVLPGGSPSGLLAVLTELDGGSVGDAVRAAHDRGATLSGASAGAMVLCAHTWRPDRGGDVVPGMGLVPGLALPHFDPGRARDVPVDEDVPRWGLPECGGVIVEDGQVVAAGQGTPVLLRGADRTVLPRDHATAVPTG